MTSSKKEYLYFIKSPVNSQGHVTFNQRVVPVLPMARWHLPLVTSSSPLDHTVFITSVIFPEHLLFLLDFL